MRALPREFWQSVLPWQLAGTSSLGTVSSSARDALGGQWMATKLTPTHKRRIMTLGSDRKVLLRELKWKYFHHSSTSRSYTVLATTHCQLSKTVFLSGRSNSRTRVWSSHSVICWRSTEIEEKLEMDNCYYKALLELQEFQFCFSLQHAFNGDKMRNRFFSIAPTQDMFPE